MEPVITPFVISSIISACINAGVAGENRQQQLALHFANQNLQREILAKQQAFTLAIEEKRLNAAANLQREILTLQYENALKLQENAFNAERARDSYARFCNNVWPLQADPDFYVNYLKKTYSERMMPLQIIVPATMPKDSFAGIDNPLTVFFNDVYSPRSGASAFYYNQGWKDSMYGSSGNAQIIALHSVLAGLPTLLLVLQKVGDEYCARVSFWGVADMDLPENKTIFTVNQKELDLDILRADADQIIKKYKAHNIQLPQDKNINIQVRLEEQQRQEELEKQGNIPEDDLKEILNLKFSSRYSKARKEDVILQERNKYLSVMLEIVSAAFTDAYYLTTYNIAPRIPELCANNPDFQHPKVIDLFQKVFSGLLENTSGDLLNTPLRYALVADSFKRNGFDEIATGYAQKSADLLQKLLKNEAELAPQHFQAIELLDDYPELAELKENIQSLPVVRSANLIPASSFDEEFFSNIPLAENVNLEMIRVKAGTFMMGSPENADGRLDDEKLHKVTLTQDYWLGKFPVTQAQFQAIMKYNPSRFGGSKRPVEEVDWNCARDFCVRLNRKFEDKLPEGYQFDLPTEAQWEYACRAGRKTAYFWGNSCNGTEANCDGNYPCGTTAIGPSLKRTTDVGTYEPNDWGFYDMHGNVCEWCRDWYKADYDGEDATDPTGPTGPEDGSYRRVSRGGSWYFCARYCRSANRNYDNPNYHSSLRGFRLALVPTQGKGWMSNH